METKKPVNAKVVAFKRKTLQRMQSLMLAYQKKKKRQQQARSKFAKRLEECTGINLSHKYKDPLMPPPSGIPDNTWRKRGGYLKEVELNLRPKTPYYDKLKAVETAGKKKGKGKGKGKDEDGKGKGKGKSKSKFDQVGEEKPKSQQHFHPITAIKEQVGKDGTPELVLEGRVLKGSWIENPFSWNDPTEPPEIWQVEGGYVYHNGMWEYNKDYEGGWYEYTARGRAPTWVDDQVWAKDYGTYRIAMIDRSIKNHFHELNGYLMELNNEHQESKQAKRKRKLSSDSNGSGTQTPRRPKVRVKTDFSQWMFELSDELVHEPLVSPNPLDNLEMMIDDPLFDMRPNIKRDAVPFHPHHMHVRPIHEWIFKSVEKFVRAVRAKLADIDAVPSEVEFRRSGLAILDEDGLRLELETIFRAQREADLAASKMARAAEAKELLLKVKQEAQEALTAAMAQPEDADEELRKAAAKEKLAKVEQQLEQLAAVAEQIEEHHNRCTAEVAVMQQLHELQKSKIRRERKKMNARHKWITQFRAQMQAMLNVRRRKRQQRRFTKLNPPDKNLDEKIIAKRVYEKQQELLKAKREAQERVQQEEERKLKAKEDALRTQLLLQQKRQQELRQQESKDKTPSQSTPGSTPKVTPKLGPQTANTISIGSTPEHRPSGGSKMAPEKLELLKMKLAALQGSKEYLVRTGQAPPKAEESEDSTSSSSSGEEEEEDQKEEQPAPAQKKAPAPQPQQGSDSEGEEAEDDQEEQSSQQQEEEASSSAGEEGEPEGEVEERASEDEDEESKEASSSDGEKQEEQEEQNNDASSGEEQGDDEDDEEPAASSSPEKQHLEDSSSEEVPEEAPKPRAQKEKKRGRVTHTRRRVRRKGSRKQVMATPTPSPSQEEAISVPPSPTPKRRKASPAPAKRSDSPPVKRARTRIIPAAELQKNKPKQAARPSLTMRSRMRGFDSD